MGNLHTGFLLLDLAGTFAFALSGATAARQRGLDLFGICTIAFIVACGGGIIRDLCIGAIPPVGISTWYYLATAMGAAGMTIGLNPVVKKLYRPVILFDAVGLSLFAVSGAQKALSFGLNGEVAVLLGIISAVGGGVLRDVLLNRVPVILEEDIYASAALIGALIMVLGDTLTAISDIWITIVAIAVCFILRLLAIRYDWNLPFFSEKSELTRDT